MSYLELFWFIGLGLILVGGFILTAVTEDAIPLVCLPLIYMFLFGVIPYGISESNTKYQETSRIEIVPKLVNLDDKQLNIVTPNYQHYTYDKYEDISKWKNGGKFYQVTLYKKCFGPDSNQLKVIID